MGVSVMVGQRFGRLVTIERKENNKNRQRRWLCACDCGEIKTANQSDLVRGKVKSCGCLHREAVVKNGKKNKTHGMTQTRLWSIWKHMKERCYYKNHKFYNHYGGRGIVVCEEWRNSFTAFRDWAFESGYMPNLTIDRKDNDGNYEPSNCRWADTIEQANNKRNNRILKYGNREMTLAQWSTETGILAGTIMARIDDLGWTIEKALSTQTRRYRYD